jgi:hypothetical protein
VASRARSKQHRLLRNGNIRAFLHEAQQALESPQFHFIARTSVGQGHLYLGEAERAMEQLQLVLTEQPARHFLHGMPEGNMLAAAALCGQTSRAEALVADVAEALPKSGRRNVQGAYYALDALITSLTLLGHPGRCGQLYGLAEDYLRTGTVVSNLTVGPSSPQLGAALAAHAAGLTDRAQEHFEMALRQAREVPMRLVQPATLYWYGRALLTTTDIAHHARGLAMLQDSLVDFHSLGMVLHANLAERSLREASV